MMDWRNPFEDFRDKYLSFKGVIGYKLLALRVGLIQYDAAKVDEYRDKAKAFYGEYFTESFVSAYRSMGVTWKVQPWDTKFYNARFSLHLGVSIWKGWLPLPFIGVCYRWNEARYFQTGIGFGPEGESHFNEKGQRCFERATLCGKFRLANSLTEYTKGGNFDVIGFYEGAI
jgi:hypothetical protein